MSYTNFDGSWPLDQAFDYDDECAKMYGSSYEDDYEDDNPYEDDYEENHKDDN